MTKPTLEKLKEQRSQLDRRIQAIESRNKVAERKNDNRRKILLGSYYLEEAKKNNQWETVKKLMDDYLKRNTDRVLFDLSKIEELKKNSKSKTEM